MPQSKETNITLAATLFIIGCASNNSSGSSSESANFSEKVDLDMGKCIGANTCKGLSSCATANGSCAGKNNCRGQGWLPLTQSDCTARNGVFSEFKKPSS